VWQDDAKLDQYEGRDGDDILVVLAPHSDSKKLPKQLIKEAETAWAKEVKKTRGSHGFKLRRDIPLYVKQPTKKSGLQIFDAHIHGLKHISNGGTVLYQLTAQDVDDAKKQISEVVVKLRLQAVDTLLRQLSSQMRRPPEAVLHLALRELSEKKDTKYYVRKEMTPQYHCRVREG